MIFHYEPINFRHSFTVFSEIPLIFNFRVTDDAYIS